MAQNTSYAVMQQRHEAHDSLDDFPTPPWATRALCECVIEPRFGWLRDLSAWEPSCNRGQMARPLGEYFGEVHASDVHDYGWEGHAETADFLFPGNRRRSDWIISNPPFRLAQQFMEIGMERANVGVAMLVRIAFLEGVERYKLLFSTRRPVVIAQFTERVGMARGRVSNRISTATAYCWLVWLVNARRHQTVFDWIPPCKRRLERPGDYDVRIRSLDIPEAPVLPA